jgi:uncharacterized repeat protein (TIGR03847 family)
MSGSHEVSMPLIEFDSVTRLTASAEGEPGRRRFYLLVSQEAIWARVWIDRDQLEALGLASQQVLASLEGKLFLDPEPTEPPQDIDRESAPATRPEVDFRAGRLTLGYDAQRDLIALITGDADAQDPSEPALACRATRQQMQRLAQRVRELLASGRPRCHLCGGPLEEGVLHVCPKANGHPSGDYL